MTSFSKKQIEIELTLGSGSFGEKGSARVIKGLACDVSIDKSGLPSKNTANIIVYNMNLSDMEALTVLSFDKKSSNRNYIVVKAGDDEDMPVVFKGDVISAIADFSGAPDVTFRIEAMTGYLASLIPSSPTSAKGKKTVDSLMSAYAVKMGFDYKNLGIKKVLKDPFFIGSAFEQAESLANISGVEMIVNDNTMTIMDIAAIREDKTATVLSSEAGMIGYPSFTQDGIRVSCVFNPKIDQGGQIFVKSIVPKASGYWIVCSVKSQLQSLGAGDSWEMDIEGVYIGR